MAFNWIDRVNGEDAILAEDVNTLAAGIREALEPVGSEKIQAVAVTTEKISDGAVTTKKLADNSVTPKKIYNNAVTGEKIANEALEVRHFPDNVIAERMIIDGAVTTKKLADNSVTEEKLSEEVVEKLNASGGGELEDGSVTTEKIANGAVTTGKIALESIYGFMHIFPNTITTSLLDGTVWDEFPARAEVESGLQSILDALNDALAITFTVDGAEYHAVNGMTWLEWAQSEYYSDAIYVSESTVCNNDDGTPMRDAFGNEVAPTDTIIEGHNYTMQEVTA